MAHAYMSIYAIMHGRTEFRLPPVHQIIIGCRTLGQRDVWSNGHWTERIYGCYFHGSPVWLGREKVELKLG